MTNEVHQDKAVIDGAGCPPEFGECKWQYLDLSVFPDTQHSISIRLF